MSAGAWYVSRSWSASRLDYSGPYFAVYLYSGGGYDDQPYWSREDAQRAADDRNRRESIATEEKSP